MGGGGGPLRAIPGDSRPLFRAGRNLSLKLPVDRLEETVTFYRDVLGLPVHTTGRGAYWVEFGAVRLWLDPAPHRALPELWLELVTDDLDAAARHLARHGVPRRDAVEPLPEGFAGFWISNPAGVVHLVCGPGEE